MDIHAQNIEYLCQYIVVYVGHDLAKEMVKTTGTTNYEKSEYKQRIL